MRSDPLPRQPILDHARLYTEEAFVARLQQAIGRMGVAPPELVGAAQP